MEVFQMLFYCMTQVVLKLNTITVSNGVLVSGFFTIVIGFLCFRICVKNFIK